MPPCETVPHYNNRMAERHPRHGKLRVIRQVAALVGVVILSGDPVGGLYGRCGARLHEGHPSITRTPVISSHRCAALSVLRSVQLWLRCEKQLLPHLGFAARKSSVQRFGSCSLKARLVTILLCTERRKCFVAKKCVCMDKEGIRHEGGGGRPSLSTTDDNAGRELTLSDIRVTVDDAANHLQVSQSTSSSLKGKMEQFCT